jgi:protein-S-isoprenylcysteine O-methyltransferase Ste14
MYLGVLLVVAGWAIGWRSLLLASYSIVLAVGFHLRVVMAEEPALARAFGEQWNAYRLRVPRWLR